MSTAVDRFTKPLKVTKKIQETSDAVSFVFEIPREWAMDFAYKPGQFVTLFLTINGEELRRSYSLSSSPFADSEFKITVKKVLNGRGSTFLVDKVQQGETLRVTPPSGHFFATPKDLKGYHYVLFAAGSGITPVFSILKSVLKINEQNAVSLVYCNRTADAIIYKKELQEWEEKYRGRLQIHHHFSSVSGRMDATNLEKVWPKLDPHSKLAKEIYLCGPVNFMENIVDYAKTHKVSAEQIHMESFGEPIHKPLEEVIPASEVDDGRVFIGDTKASGAPDKLFAVFNGEAVEVSAKPELSVLETLLNEGYNPPYSCMDGACMACMAKLVEGRVYQKDPGILTEDNIERCEILTCQAKPLSSTVRVDYDNL